MRLTKMNSNKHLLQYRTVGSFFMVGGWVKMRSPWLIDDENLKKHLLKHPKAVPQKRNLDQNINDLKSQIYNPFFENIISGI